MADPVFNYISTLRDNCGEPCMSQECRPTITCEDIEFPNRFGVEFNGTPTSFGADCGEVTNFYGGPWNVSITGYDFPWFGTPVAVDYADIEGGCFWCLPASEDYSYGDAPSGVDIDHGSCEAGSVECQGVLTTGSTGHGWQTHPGTVSGEYMGICTECDVAFYSESYVYTSESAPSLFKYVRVQIEKRTAAQAPEFADGLRVTVALTFWIVGKKYTVTRVGECLVPCEPYECEGDSPVPPHLICAEQCNADPESVLPNPVTEWWCSFEKIAINNTYTRFFAGATEWEDIIDEEIPGGTMGNTNTATCICDNVVPVVAPFFAYDYFWPCVVGEHPQGLFAADLQFAPYDYEALCAESTDNYVILRDV